MSSVRHGRALRRMAPVLPAIAAALGLIVVAGCSESPDEFLPRFWVSIDNPNSDDYRIGIVLLPDGTGAVRNWPIWDGSGACTQENTFLYDGIVAWREEGSVPVVGAPAGDVKVLPDIRVGMQDWDKLVLNFCGEGSPDVIFWGGMLRDDEGLNMLDTWPDVDWDHVE